MKWPHGHPCHIGQPIAPHALGIHHIGKLQLLCKYYCIRRDCVKITPDTKKQDWTLQADKKYILEQITAGTYSVARDVRSADLHAKHR